MEVTRRRTDAEESRENRRGATASSLTVFQTLYNIIHYKIKRRRPLKKSFILFLSVFSLTSCVSSRYVSTDILGNPSTDKFASTYADTVSIQENGTVKVINNNTIKACGYSSLDTARQEAYALSLDMNSTQDIKGVSNMSCLNGTMSNGCSHEYNLSTVMADKKLVNTKKENDCYTFTFKKMNNFKSVKSTDTYSSYSRPFSKNGESIVNVNIVNFNTHIRAKMNGKGIWINNNDKFEIVGPKDVVFEIIDKRFEYKKFIIKVPREPKIITKNISLVQLKRKVTKHSGNAAGFERQDYIDTTSGERVILLWNRNQIDPSNSDTVNVHAGLKFYITFKQENGRTIISVSRNTNACDENKYCYFQTNQHNVKEIRKQMRMKIVVYDENLEKIEVYKFSYDISLSKEGKIYINTHNTNDMDEYYYKGEKFNTTFTNPNFYSFGFDIKSFVENVSKIDVSIY